MALTGRELVTMRGVINSGRAAKKFITTTQNIANLNTTGAVAPLAPLTGREPVEFLGITSNYAVAVPALTTTALIQALGSIAPSTLTGNEIVVINAPVIGQSRTANIATVTTHQIAG